MCDNGCDVGDIIQYSLYADAHSFSCLLLGKFLSGKYWQTFM